MALKADYQQLRRIAAPDRISCSRCSRTGKYQEPLIETRLTENRIHSTIFKPEDLLSNTLSAVNYRMGDAALPLKTDGGTDSVWHPGHKRSVPASHPPLGTRSGWSSSFPLSLFYLRPPISFACPNFCPFFLPNLLNPTRVF
ncbi:hypothetical protein GOODEAATRI_020238 [Goodea atripinnis]|uniref:Uncharacterized protein n=1 Tax=Goodea atripinnis TaxID=208336 RepID=A0ABV0MJB3_9TELE